nr:hypothetical protein [Tanacetum cinerariifolium]
PPPLFAAAYVEQTPHYGCNGGGSGVTGRLRGWGNRGRGSGSWLWRWYCCGGGNGGGKAAAKVVVVRRWLAEEVRMVSAVKRGGSG